LTGRIPGITLGSRKGTNERDTKRIINVEGHMKAIVDRREFLKLAGVSLMFLGTMGRSSFGASQDGAQGFMFAQLSDTHWGFDATAVNPDFAGTLRKAVASVNSLKPQPDFVVFTGDLTHTTDDGAERRKRLTGFGEIVKDLAVKTVRFIPGEHDASLDKGEAFKELFGETHYTFDHKGVHFIALDNVSDPRGMVGDSQIEWLAADLKGRDNSGPIVVLTHRPLFDLYPQWDWATRDGARVIEALTPFTKVTVLYGHIHQEHHHVTGRITHDAARGLMYPLPAPGSVPEKKPIPWDAAQPYKGLGFRSINKKSGTTEYVLTEYPVKKGA
jgi:3',5'-cyclic AMP phosphodiesterase CpdA